MASCGVSDGAGHGLKQAWGTASSILHLRFVPPSSDDKNSASKGEFFQGPPLNSVLQREFCTRITPVWETTTHGVLLDLGGMERLHGPWAAGAGAVCGLARAEFPVWSAGLASSPLAAKLASLVGGMGHGQQLYAVPEGSVPSFLAGFSIHVLSPRFDEISRLRSLGVRTLGDLQTLPKDLLAAVFGPVGAQLAQEASGLHSEVLGQDRSRSEPWPVAKIRFAKPLVSRVGEKALRRSLAIRALCSVGGPGRWFLRVEWSSGARARVSHSGPRSESWPDWLGMMDGLWDKLPAHRQGVCELELLFRGSAGGFSRQMSLFDNPDEESDLSQAMVHIRQKFDSSFAPASEALLQQWGACWVDVAGKNRLC